MPTPTVKPTISPVQSVLGYLQWQAFEFLPSAVNFPTTWYCSALPPGLYFDDTTGAIFGAVTMPGVYTFVLYAENVVGISNPQSFVMGIEASGFVEPSNVVDVSIDVATRRVSLAGLLADAATTGAAANANTSTPEAVNALFWAKAGDDLIFNVRFTKGGVQFDPDLTGLKFALKEYEPDATIIEADEDEDHLVKVSSGANASFRLYVHLDDDEIRAALSNYENDQGTQFVALAEFEWTQTNTAGVGPEEIRGSSRTFGVMLVRDLIENPA